MNTSTLSLYLFVLFFIAMSQTVKASPWIDASDLYTRIDIQNLANAGVITAPVITFPLMWAAISDDLEKANTKDLPIYLVSAHSRLINKYRQIKANKNQQEIKLSLASVTKRFNSFGTSQHEKAQLSLSVEGMYDNWFGKLSTQFRKSPADGESKTHDNSQIAYLAGNWMIKLGSYQQWWGPGWDSSLILSNNSRPLPAIGLSRYNSKAFDSQWLSWIGPWTFTAQMAKLESNRIVPNALLWSTRGTIRPLSALEIGLSWSMQWAGEGQPNSLKDFVRSATGQEECANGASDCDSSLNTKIGNHLAGVDIRWSTNIAGVPIALYGQTIGEDAVKYIEPADKAYIFGIDSHIPFNNPIHVFAEYTETQVACGESSALNCYYEHSIYRTGYRYQRRALGTSFDNDAKIWTLGLSQQNDKGHKWSAKLRLGKLNSDNNDPYPNTPSLGNQVAKVSEELSQLELAYHFPLFKGLLSMSADISYSSFIDKASESKVDVFASWEYRY